MAEGVEIAVAPWTQRVRSGRACCLRFIVGCSGSSRRWVRALLDSSDASPASCEPRPAGASRDSDEDSEDRRDRRRDVKQRTPMALPDRGHQSVVEWVLLLQALASVDASMVARAVAQLAGRALRGEESFGVMLEGTAATLRAALVLLTHDQDALSAEFKHARATVLGDGPLRSPGRNAIVVRMRVNTSRKAAPDDTSHLDGLASAIRDSDRWYRSQTDETPPLVPLEAVDFHIGDYETLDWLADSFPRDSGACIGGLVCSGDLNPSPQLEAAVKRLLLEGRESGRRPPPPIQNLVLQCPLDAHVLRIFCSAIQRAASLAEVSFSNVLQDDGRDSAARSRRWQQFAAALFGQQATHQLRRMHIHEWTLLPGDVRAVVEAIDTGGPGQHSPLALTTLDVNIFSRVQGGTITPLVELIHAVRHRLPRLASLTLNVMDEPAINDAVALAVVDGFAPTLRSLSLVNVKLDSLAALLSPTTDKRLRLRSLHLHNLFIGDMTSCSPFFEKLLGDVTNPIARHLETLRIYLSARQSRDDVRTIVSLVKSMLEQNPRIVHCEISGYHTFAVKTMLESIHGQPAVEPLRLACRAAFLSVFQRPDDHIRTVTKKPRVDHAHALSRPHQDALALVFAFAASATTRVAIVGRSR